MEIYEEATMYDVVYILLRKFKKIIILSFLLSWEWKWEKNSELIKMNKVLSTITLLGENQKYIIYRYSIETK